MKTREEYIVKMKQQLDELNLAIEEYESKAHQAQVEAQITYKDNLFKLRQQLALTHEKLEELKASSENSWDQLVTETERVRAVLVDSFHYFKTHI
jgi:hypothetical protein